MTTKRIGSEALTAVRGRAVWWDLGPAALVRLHGPDARRFCNGMFSNNVRDLSVGGHNRHALLDDRGRIGGFVDLCCVAEDQFVAVVDGLDVAGFLERYERYVVFDEVELAAIPGWRHLTVQGPAWRALPLFDEALRRGVDDQPFAFPRTRAPGGGADLVVPEPLLPSVVAALSVGALQVGDDDAEVLRVLAGVARHPQDTGDKRLVAEIGLREELLSFDKGCYLGQETVNRVDVMGEVRRALVGIRVPGPVALGAEVRAGEQVVGELTSAGTLPDGSTVGLAVLKKPADAPGTEVAVGGVAGRVEALPFA